MSWWWVMLLAIAGTAVGVWLWVRLALWLRRRRYRTWLGTDPTKPFYVYREGPGHTETIIRPATAVQVIKGGKTPDHWPSR